MNHTTRNILLIISAIIVSIFLASSFGYYYHVLSPLSFGRGITGTTDFWELVAGFPLALIFFLILLFEAFGDNNRKKWLMWSLAFPVLFELVFDFSHIYFPIALGLVAYGIGWGVRKILKIGKK